MLVDFSKTEIESAKDSIENNIIGLAQDYLKNHSSLVEENLYGYDGCSKTRMVWKEEDQEAAFKEAKKTLIELIENSKF